MNIKRIYSIVAIAILGISIIMFSSCSKEEGLVNDSKRDITLEELQSMLNENPDKSVAIQENFTEPETGIEGTLFNISYNDGFNEELLIADEEPQFTDKTASGIIKSMSVWVDKETGQGYWSCGAGVQRNCMRILGITIAW